MVNRNYLPFKSAREYEDRSMAKWMGFFISEHSTALTKEYIEEVNREMDYKYGIDTNVKNRIVNM